MREFSFEEITDHLSKIHPLVPRKVLKKIAIYSFSRITACVATGRDRVTLYKCDLMTIYTPHDVKKLCGEFFDLDETKSPSRRQSIALKVHRKKFSKDYRKWLRKQNTYSRVARRMNSSTMELQTWSPSKT